MRKAVRELASGARLILPIGGAALLTTVVAVGWYTQPDRYARGYAPAQPIPYSHKLHAGTLKIPCLYCHVGADRSRYAGVPPTETCMNCHRVTKTESPHIQKLAALHEKGEPVLWERIHALPDHTYFDHRPHVAAGILCQTCHGEVQQMEVVSQQMSLRMGNCLGCHREAHAALPRESRPTLPRDSDAAPPRDPTRARGPEHCNACHR